MKFSKELMKGAAELLVLKALKDSKEAYGYELIRSISVGSHNVFEFQEGTLYPLLYRLEAKGYVASHKKVAQTGKERRYYALTKSGQRVLKDGANEMSLFLSGIKSALNLSV